MKTLFKIFETFGIEQLFKLHFKQFEQFKRKTNFYSLKLRKTQQFRSLSILKSVGVASSSTLFRLRSTHFKTF
jgi:hypothetical protein